MAYHWKPSKQQKKEFKRNMQDEDFANAYYERKEARKEKKRSKSNFDYDSAGGEYVPTELQNDFAMSCDRIDLSDEQEFALEQVLYGYSCKEKINHDYIHIVNEMIRN